MLRNSACIAVVTHIHPDGDALGSSSAMYHYIKANYPAQVKILAVEESPANIAFIREGTEVVSDSSLLGKCDLVVVLDLNTLSRTESALEMPLRSCTAPKVLIDHHLNPAVAEFDLVMSTPQVSSASELLYWVLKALGGEIPLSAARALMCGMTTDTNNFANSVFPSTLRMTSELLEAGVNRDDVINRLFKSYRVNRLKAFSYFVGEKMVISGPLAYIVITEEELKRFSLEEGELEGLVNEPLSLAGIQVSVTAKQDGDQWRISLRSKAPVVVNGIASDHFNGGGHAQASGGRLYRKDGFTSPEIVAAHIEKYVRI